MKLRYSARTDVGKKREINEDSYAPQALGPERVEGQLIVLCDGMGGHAAGEVASSLGVATILETYYEVPGENRPAALRHAFEEANQRIYHDGHGSMGTTGVAALIHDATITIANVGDSRAYLVHGGVITQISHDHSYVSEQVEAGLMTPEQARMSMARNIITRALGHQSDVHVDLFNVAASEGDIVVLSSDGLHGLIDDEVIQEAVRLLPPEEATEKLIKLANQSGGTDNITVMVLRLDRIDNALDANAVVGDEPPLSVHATRRLPETIAAAAPQAPIEHPLSRNGLLLALLTLLVLLGGGGLALFYPTMVSAPVVTPAPASPVVLTPSVAVGSPTAAVNTPPVRATTNASPLPSTPAAATTPALRVTSSPQPGSATATP